MSTHEPEQGHSGTATLDEPHKVSVERSMTILRPRAELYEFWRDLTNLPRFMTHLRSVTVLDAKRSRWVAQAPDDRTVEWDAIVTEDVANERIA
ncbi:MAG: hypothetical protein M3081_09195 [Gemmatimonadota bacterium]|nr:hypothetical protein [Gemmatimonadota bacterium]